MSGDAGGTVHDNPSPEELATLKSKGFAVDEVDPANFHKKEVYVKKVTLLPFYYGFDLGLDPAAGAGRVFKQKALTAFGRYRPEPARHS